MPCHAHRFCTLPSSQLILPDVFRFVDVVTALAYSYVASSAFPGDKRLFIRHDELEAAWSLFTPVLHELEEKAIQPELYPYGSRGPLGAHYLGAKYNVRWGDLLSTGDST